MLDGVDDNNIGCHTPHGNSAGTEGTMMFHGVNGVVDGGERHVTHLTQEVDCCLTTRKKQHTSGECQDHEVPNVMKSRSVLYVSAKLNDRKEDNETMLLNDIDNSVDGGDNHLTHLSTFGSNDGVDGYETFTHIAKNNSESLRSDITGHGTHVNFFGNMLVSKKLFLWLRVCGLKDDRESIDNSQKDNENKSNGDKNNGSPSQGGSFSSTMGSQKNPIYLTIITVTIVMISVLTIVMDFTEK
eukprot:196782-Ditylum_brightwellii.AAC.1